MLTDASALCLLICGCTSAAGRSVTRAKRWTRPQSSSACASPHSRKRANLCPTLLMLGPTLLDAGVGGTHQTVLERGTAEHSDRPHRAQASAVKSKSPELGPSGPRWTRCDNRRNFLYNRSNLNFLTIGLDTGIRASAHFSNQVPELSAGKKTQRRKPEVVAIHRCFTSL